MYLSKLPPCKEELWLKPKKKVHVEDDLWYERTVVGPHPLENFMKLLSEQAGLSRIYTNHCIRSTVITNLDEKGFEARHITAVLGHKSENTIKSYSTKCPESKKREMSDALSSVLGQPSPIPAKKKVVESTCSKPPQSDQFNTINVADLVDWIPIENNKEDFDLGQILQEVDSNATATRPPPPLQVTVPQEKDPVTTTQNTVVHNITTNREMQHFPFFPKMYFPNSNVTINYNFNK